MNWGKIKDEDFSKCPKPSESGEEFTVSSLLEYREKEGVRHYLML